MPDKETRICLFGGTFDPVHLGHVRAAAEVASIFTLDKVMFIPSHIPPHKAGAVIAPAEDRLAMVELACREDLRFVASDMEVRAERTSYSVLTVSQVRETYPRARVFFLIGIDAFLEIGTWREYRRLFELCSFIVMSRPGCDLSRTASALDGELAALTAPVTGEGKPAPETESSFRVFPVSIRPQAISSTDIRERVRTGRSVDGLVPPLVLEYIERRDLYLR